MRTLPIEQFHMCHGVIWRLVVFDFFQLLDHHAHDANIFSVVKTRMRLIF